MDESCSCEQSFIGQVRPLLERGDAEKLIDYLGRHWPPRELTRLLGCGDGDAIKTALVCLGLTGQMSDCPPIVTMLHADDEDLVDFAEQALWSIWFRAGDEYANATLSRAVQMISEEQFAPAIEWLSVLALRHPQYAEVYHQRAMARFLVDHYEQALGDARQALHLNPLHFGAMTAQAHCHAARGELEDALVMYRAALKIHPRMEGIRESLAQVCRCLCKRSLSC
jgi:hypothetical protein